MIVRVRIQGVSCLVQKRGIVRVARSQEAVDDPGEIVRMVQRNGDGAIQAHMYLYSHKTSSS